MSAQPSGKVFKSPVASRILALALLVLLAVILICAVAIPAWFTYQRYNTNEARMTRQLSSYTALNEMRPKMLRAVEVLKEKDTKKLFLKGTTPALAGADLQDVVKMIVESNSGRVLSSQLLAHRDDNGYRLINAKLQLSTNIQNLRQILYAIESREPFLFVENLNIRAQVPSDFKPQPGFEPEMFVQFDVAGIVTVAQTATEDKSATKPKPQAAGAKT